MNLGEFVVLVVAPLAAFLIFIEWR